MMKKPRRFRLALATVVFSFFSLSMFAQANQWTWMSGTNSVDQPGIYGTKGMAAAANQPGGREGSVSWTDATGNLWLFGA